MIAHAGGGGDEWAALGILLAAAGIGMAAKGRLDSGRRPLAVALAIAAGAVAFLAFFVPIKFLRPSVAKVRPASTATIEVLAPRAGEVVAGKTLPVQIRLTGGRIVQLTSKNLRPDEGHVHLSIDGKLLSMTLGFSQRVDISGLGNGEHLLTVEFVASDHAPFAPRVQVSTTFTVRR